MVHSHTTVFWPVAKMTANHRAFVTDSALVWYQIGWLIRALAGEVTFHRKVAARSRGYLSVSGAHHTVE